MHMSFKFFAKFTLVSIFLIIVAGSVVRMTGSGMGCPDWPMCFGFIIPPTHIEQVEWKETQPFFAGQMIIYESQLLSAKTNFTSGGSYDASNWEPYKKHNYAIFNATHTWFEYINRLIGALSGIFTFVMLLMSLRFWNSKRKIVFLSAVVVFLMGFQAWLGATVVFSVLQPAQITIHMLVALLIVALMMYLISELPESTKKDPLIFDKTLNRLLVVAIILSLIQITLGTQVRQLIDEISRSLGHTQRDLWIGLAGNTFKFHRSFAISLVVVHALLFYRNYKLQWSFRGVNALVFVVALEVLSGIILTYFDMMALMQPIHLVAASLLFVIQISLYFQFKKLKTT
jgi:cytochrome c oxidase assembly protein subunit 15